MKGKFVKKKVFVLTVSYLTAAAVCLGALAWTSHSRAERYKLYNQYSYQHAFGELVTAVGEMDTALKKSLYATSPSMISAVCTEVFGKAMTAQMSLGVLPLNPHQLERTSGFISRVGDYAFSLSRSASNGQGYTAEQLESLRALSDTAETLAQNLKSLRTDLDDGVLTMDELMRSQSNLQATEESLPATLGDSIKLIEQEFPEVPSLIYDGPFSEHLTDREPLMLKDEVDIDENEARRVAADFLGVNRARVYSTGECGGDIPCYCLASGDRGSETTVAVTKRGGLVLSMLSSRPIGREKVDVETALATAGSFLEKNGIKNMKETYHMNQGGVLTVNYAYQQSGVICYSDLIKVSVALDTGKVCGYEARGYITTHCVREIPQAQVDESAALACVPQGLSVLSHSMAIVPSDGQYELYCHEFKCADDRDRHYIIYVNAENGRQEKILILLEDESGTLTL